MELIARPVAVVAYMLPFGFSLRESSFASYVGLRGAAPIYLSLIPGQAEPIRDTKLFAVVFITVVTLLFVQDWTVAPTARLLGYKSRPTES